MLNSYRVTFEQTCDELKEVRAGTSQSESKRHRWRYVVLLGSFTLLMLEMATLLTVGVYLVHLKEEFDSSAGIAGWLASSVVAVMGFTSKSCHSG